jgi:hypothetical protein
VDKDDSVDVNENEDDKLFREENMIENHIQHELKVLDRIVAKRRKEGAKHLHQFKLVREDLDAMQQKAAKEAAEKEGHEQARRQEAEQEAKEA